MIEILDLVKKAKCKAAILNQIKKLFSMHQQQVLCYCCRRFHWLLFEDCWETADHTLSCLNLLHTVLNRLCKWAYGDHIGSNQKIVLRASTTGVVLMLCKVSMISVWRQLRNSWSHTLVSNCWQTDGRRTDDGQTLYDCKSSQVR